MPRWRTPPGAPRPRALGTGEPLPSERLGCARSGHRCCWQPLVRDSIGVRCPESEGLASVLHIEMDARDLGLSGRRDELFGNPAIVEARQRCVLRRRRIVDTVDASPMNCRKAHRTRLAARVDGRSSKAVAV